MLDVASRPMLSGVRGATAYPGPPAAGCGGACGGLPPAQAWRHLQCPLARVSAKTTPVHPAFSLNKKLKSGKPALSRHLSAISTAKK